MWTRRAMMGGTAAAMAAAPLVASKRMQAANRDGWFERAVVIDGLSDFSDPYNDDGHLRMSDRGWAENVATGLDCVCITLRPVGFAENAWQAFEDSVETYSNRIAANPDRLVLIREAADVLTAKQAGKIGMLFGTQDTIMIGTDLGRLAKMREMGTRIVQVTYNLRNLAGDGALEEADGGLSRLGYAMIEEIEAQKMLLDLSHGGARTMAQAAAKASRPLVISHTGARALYDHPRATGDATMKAVADKGGVIGLYFIPYLSAAEVPTGETVLNHLDHIKNVAGEDAVGLSTDNGTLPWTLDEKQREELRANQKYRIDNGIAAPGETMNFLPFVPDYNVIDLYQRVAEDLMDKRGWTVSQAEKLVGGNFLRVYRDGFG
ncbi:dipeptidase [Sphingomicrobium flavum]|uniref:dipeptidase n=1 Tax=Sphingomicrobium flavum TaxID=1229164 RepID=UPI0021ADE1E2|nr:dipeptidase [Sphingomicrobium flavum]